MLGDSAPSTGPVVGVDVGATLCKLVAHGVGRTVACLPASALAEIHARVAAWAPARVVATGGGADRLGDRIAGVAVERVDEFSAWARGAAALAADQGLDLPARHVVVSIGTGTSILAVTDGRGERVGGTALGGGTLLGLGRLLLGTDAFAALVVLARAGDRRRVDLLLGDVYAATAGSPAGDLTAASFAKLGSSAPADLAHALMGVVGENLALLAGACARLAGAEAVLYCGSTLMDNPPLRDIIASLAALTGQRPLFVAQGGYAGALGAALTPVGAGA